MAVAFSELYSVQGSYFQAPSDWIPWRNGIQDEMDAKGYSEASWTIPFTPGSRVSLWWLEWPDRTTQAICTVSDNGSVLNKLVINQQLSASANAAALGTTTVVDANGKTFLDLGTFSPSNGALTITLAKSSADTDPSKMVIADTLRVESPVPLPLPARLDRVLVAPAGKSLALLVTDLLGRPCKISEVKTVPTISVNGGSAITLINPVYSKDDPRAWLLYPLTGTSGVLSAPLSLTDSVIVNVVDGWATCVSGDVSGVSGAATHVPSTLLPPFEVGPKTMRLGYNINSPNFYTPMIYANLASQSLGWLVRTAGQQVGDVAVDSFGNATFLNSGDEIWLRFSQNPGIDITPGEGVYTLQYRSDSKDCSAFFGDHTGLTNWGLPTVTTLSGGRVRVQQYLTHPKDRSAMGAVVIGKSKDPVNDPLGNNGKIPGPYPIDIRDIEIYGPNVDPDNPPLFLPEFMGWASPSMCLRFMDCFHAGASTIVAKEDFYNRFERLTCEPTSGFLLGGKVISISTYDNSDGFYSADANNFTPILFEFAEPHGMREGQVCSFSGFVGPNGDGTFPLKGGHYLGTDGVHKAGDPVGPGNKTFFNNWGGNVHVVSPTKVTSTTIGVGYASAMELDGTFTTDLGDSARVTVMTKVGLDPQDCVIMSNMVGADAWISAPYNATDETFAWLFDLVAKSLRPDLRCYVELGDETWNWGFQAAQWALTQGRLMSPPGNNDTWTVKRSGEMWEIAEAAFAAAGRPKSDVVRVLGSQVGWPWIGQVRMQYAVDNNIRVDALALAPYFQNEPVDKALGSLYDSMDQDQIMDVAELSMAYGNTSIDWFYQCITTLKKLLPNAECVCYEGGPGDGRLTTASLSNHEVDLRSRKWAYNPRMRGIMLSYLQQLQDAGCTLFVDFTLCGAIGGDVWSCYTYWNMKPGLGDGSDGLQDNSKADPDYLRNVVSVVAGANEYWNSLVKPAKPREGLGVERRSGYRRSRRR